MSLNPVPLEFGEWLPDMASRTNPALAAKGVRSISNQYRPFPSIFDYQGSDAATATKCLGFAGVYDSSLNGQIFLGDTTKLFWLVSRVATDISKGGGYSIGSDDWWCFAQFGDNVVAVANGTAPQVYTMGVSSIFADLGGSPPTNAHTVARVNDFLWMGKDFTCYWSAFNNIADWTPSTSTQAGTQDLDQAQGRIQTIIGGDYATIFQERAIRRALYIGGDVIWDFGQDAVETRRGAIGPKAAVRYGRNVFFIADDGFYVFDGQSSTSIGEGKVDDYFRRMVQYPYGYLCQVGLDSTNKTLVFGVPTGSSTTINRLFIFSLSDGRWTEDEVTLDQLGDVPVEPFTVDNFHIYETSDDLDTTNLDALNIDSDVFDEKRRLLAGVQTNFRLGTFTGTARPAEIETMETEVAPGRRALVTEIWPVGDFLQANVTTEIGTRQRPGQGLTYSNGASMNDQGVCPHRTDGRFIRCRLKIGAGAAWTHAERVYATFDPSGWR